MGSEYSFFWRKTCQIKFIIHGHVHPNSPKNMLSNITKSCGSSLVVLYSQNYLAGICGHYHESSVCLEYSKKFLPKKSGSQKFQTPNNSPITPITRNLGYPPGSCPKSLFQNKAKYEAFEMKELFS